MVNAVFIPFWVLSHPFAYVRVLNEEIIMQTHSREKIEKCSGRRGTHVRGPPPPIVSDTLALSATAASKGYIHRDECQVTMTASPT